MRFQSVRQAAREYAARGFRVVPLYGVDECGECRCGDMACKPRDAGKHENPAFDGQWKSGHSFGPDDFAEEDNLALVMGAWRPGRWLVALDVDGADDAEAFFPRLPRTLTQTTPRGAHFVFTVPDRTPLGNWVDVFRTKHAGFSLDLRYARGRIVAAPSKGAVGEYTWRDWRQPVPLPPTALEAIYAQRREVGLPVQERWDRGAKQP